MIDLINCKNEFIKYTEQFDLNIQGIKRKQLHSLRVMEKCKKIVESLNLSQEEVEVATLIGLLHDIGKALDHDMEGTHVEIGVDILKKYKIVTKWAGARHVPAYVEVYGYGSHSEPYGVGHHRGTGAAGAAGAACKSGKCGL